MGSVTFKVAELIFLYKLPNLIFFVRFGNLYKS